MREASQKLQHHREVVVVFHLQHSGGLVNDLHSYLTNPTEKGLRAGDLRLIHDDELKFRNLPGAKVSHDDIRTINQVIKS